MTAQFTAREFNQDASRVKRASQAGPVFITDRGKPAHVLMTVAAYERLKKRQAELPLVAFLEALALDGLDLTREADAGRDPML
ncbi:MAG: type II toxin-antitoxin system prevent-host-death family antitoxin [Novosphingobium sp.]